MYVNIDCWNARQCLPRAEDIPVHVHVHVTLPRQQLEEVHLVLKERLRNQQLGGEAEEMGHNDQGHIKEETVRMGPKCQRRRFGEIRNACNRVVQSSAPKMHVMCRLTPTMPALQIGEHPAAPVHGIPYTKNSYFFMTCTDVTRT